MLDPLIDRQDRQVAGAAEAPVAPHGLEIAQDGDRPIRADEDAIDKVGTRKNQLVPLDPLALVLEQRRCLGPKQLTDIHTHRSPPVVATTLQRIPSSAGGFARRRHA